MKMTARFLQRGFLLAFLASSASASASASAPTLIDVLKQNGATQFALALEASPDLPFFLSSEIHTVFAPIDGYVSNNTGAVRRTSVRDQQLQLSRKTTSLSADNGVMSSSSTTRMARRAIADGLGSAGVVVETFESAPKLSGNNFSVVVEFGLSLSSFAKRHDTDYGHSSLDYGHSSAWSSSSSSCSTSTSTLPLSQYKSQTPSSTKIVPPIEASHVSATTPTAAVGTGSPSGVVPKRKTKVASGDGYRVNVLRTDIPYNNGLIHLTDGYFELPDPVSTTLKVTGLTGFSNLLTQTNLSSAIDARSSITIFAPSNAAISAANLGSSSPGQLAGVVNTHIIPNFVGYLPALTNGASYKTLGGGSVTITIKNGDYYVNDAKIIGPDVITDNGVIHVIDKVLTSGPVLSNSYPGSLLQQGWTLAGVIGAVTLALAFKY